MPRITVVTDSSAALPPKLLARHSIRVVPLALIWGTQVFHDDVDMTPEQFYERLSHDPTLPTTSQPSPEQFTSVYEEVAPGCDGIVAVLISSRLSATTSSAHTAASQFTRVPVRVVDSHSTVMGLGFAALAAARVADQDASLDDVVETAQSVAEAMNVLFTVDTLTYLHRGGRIGGASRFLGTILNVKPLLHLTEGRIDALERVRTRRNAMSRMVELMAKRLSGRPSRVAVIHANAPNEADTLLSLARKRLSCVELHTAHISPAIGVHTGPGTLGLVAYPMEAEQAVGVGGAEDAL